MISHQNDIEDYGIKEQEFVKLFNFQPVYTLSDLCKFLMKDFKLFDYWKQFSDFTKRIGKKKLKNLKLLFELNNVDFQEN